MPASRTGLRNRSAPRDSVQVPHKPSDSIHRFVHGLFGNFATNLPRRNNTSEPLPISPCRQSVLPACSRRGNETRKTDEIGPRIFFGLQPPPPGMRRARAHQAEAQSASQERRQRDRRRRMDRSAASGLGSRSGLPSRSSSTICPRAGCGSRDLVAGLGYSGIVASERGWASRNSKNIYVPPR